MTGEFAFLEGLRDRFPAIGDDTAVVDPPHGSLLLSTDLVVEGVHFDGTWPAGDVGRKAVAVNVSDVAAMGGRPLHLLVSVAAPAGAALDELVEGIASAARDYGCEVVGGDLSTTSGPMIVNVAITGTVDAPIRRSGARAGDVVYVTGPLGAAAAAGYRHVPVARVAEGQRAREEGATAMIDVSDGLATDLRLLADASGVGIALDQLPVAPGATEEQALQGGEDYELVFTGPPGMSGIPIGTCGAEPGALSWQGRPLAPGGWEHRF